MTLSFPGWTSDAELFALAKRELYSAVIGDVLDLAGRQLQFLPPRIRPLSEDLVVCGRAMPVLEADIEGGDMDPSIRPFGLMLQALDDLKPGEVYICSGASSDYALWGELMSTCALNRGAAGAVLDGWSRDTSAIRALKFPCFSRGQYAQDQRPRGKVVEFRCALEIGGVAIRPGDLIFGDLDGVVVIPREIETDVIRGAWEKAHGENRVREAIKAGLGAQEAWDKFGIL